MLIQGLLFRLPISGQLFSREAKVGQPILFVFRCLYFETIVDIYFFGGTPKLETLNSFGFWRFSYLGTHLHFRLLRSPTMFFPFWLLVVGCPMFGCCWLFGCWVFPFWLFVFLPFFPFWWFVWLFSRFGTRGIRRVLPGRSPGPINSAARRCARRRQRRRRRLRRRWMGPRRRNERWGDGVCVCACVCVGGCVCFFCLFVCLFVCLLFFFWW